MSEQPIVHKEAPMQSQVNPFAKHLEGHVNAGTVAIESERAIAEAQGKLVIAKRFPRDQALAYTRIIDACKRQGMADEACYSFPRGGQNITGPTIRLAEMLAANWGNLDYGIRELSRKDGVSEMEAYCWDLESNVMSSQKFTVRHIRDTKQGPVHLKDERDIYELTANQGGRRLRARILAILPGDLIQAAVDQCDKTLAGGNELPIADRIRSMIAAFGPLGVIPAMLEKYLKHPLDKTTPDELADLRKIHNSLRDGMSKIANWFNDGTTPVDSDGDDIPMGEPPTRPEPKPRQKRGAATVVENPPEQQKVVAPPMTSKPTGPEVQGELVEEAKPITQPTPVTPPADAAKAHAAAQALKDEKAVTPAPTPEPEKPVERAFLKDQEKITTICTVKEVIGLLANMAPKEGEPKVPTPTVKAKVAGGFNGEVYQFRTGTIKGDIVVPPAEWAVGSKIKLQLLGRMNKSSGKVMVVVESIDVEASPNTAMDVE